MQGTATYLGGESTSFNTAVLALQAEWIDALANTEQRLAHLRNHLVTAAVGGEEAVNIPNTPSTREIAQNINFQTTSVASSTARKGEHLSQLQVRLCCVDGLWCRVDRSPQDVEDTLQRLSNDGAALVEKLWSLQHTMLEREGQFASLASVNQDIDRIWMLENSVG